MSRVQGEDSEESEDEMPVSKARVQAIQGEESESDDEGATPIANAGEKEGLAWRQRPSGGGRQWSFLAVPPLIFSLSLFLCCFRLFSVCCVQRDRARPVCARLGRARRLPRKPPDRKSVYKGIPSSAAGKRPIGTH